MSLFYLDLDPCTWYGVYRGVYGGVYNINRHILHSTTMLTVLTVLYDSSTASAACPLPQLSSNTPPPIHATDVGPPPFISPPISPSISSTTSASCCTKEATSASVL